MEGIGVAMAGITERGEELKQSFFRVAGRFHKLHSYSRFQGVSHQEYVVLEMVGKYMQEHPNQPGVYISELVRIQKTSPPAISRTLRSMEEKGWIEKETDANDRRNTFIRLTAAGEKKRRKAADEINEFVDSVIARLGEEKMVNMIAIWEEMENIMLDEIKKRRKK